MFWRLWVACSITIFNKSCCYSQLLYEDYENILQSVNGVQCICCFWPILHHLCYAGITYGITHGVTLWYRDSLTGRCKLYEQRKAFPAEIAGISVDKWLEIFAETRDLPGCSSKQKSHCTNAVRKAQQEHPRIPSARISRDFSIICSALIRCSLMYFKKTCPDPVQVTIEIPLT